MHETMIRMQLSDYWKSFDQNAPLIFQRKDAAVAWYFMVALLYSDHSFRMPCCFRRKVISEHRVDGPGQKHGWHLISIDTTSRY
jgi:hypothetical protein